MASSEPDGVAADGSGGDDAGDEKMIKTKSVTEEKWWQTTLQVSIPFLIAGLGTIAAGIILGRVEVRIKFFFTFPNAIKFKFDKN